MPARDGRELVISLERMSRIRDIDPVNFTMTVDAGCILETVKQAAAEHACDFPLSLGAQGNCQIATNAGDLNVQRHGLIRQLVLGLELVLPDGRLWDGLHALHKDNRGLDLKQLFLGSEGPWTSFPAPFSSWFRGPNRVAPRCWAALRRGGVDLYVPARRGCSDLLTAFELIPRRCIELAKVTTPSLRDPMDKAHP